LSIDTNFFIIDFFHTNKHITWGTISIL
jgi:hypothetical protein